MVIYILRAVNDYVEYFEVLKDGSHQGNIHIIEGDPKFCVFNIQELEQILSKMKELQSEVK